MSQILLEAFNSIPYPTERTEKNGMMDISYTFEDETNHSYRFHFEKRVNYGRNVFVLTLGQKSPNIKMYKRVFGKFHNPLRVIATLIDIVKDNRQKRSDVKGLIIEVPEQAFGAHGRLVDKIIKRELRTELKVQDLELSIEEFEKMGLKGVVATVKPYQFDSVFNGKIMKDILDKRSEGEQSAENTPVPEKPVVRSTIDTLIRGVGNTQLQIDVKYDGDFQGGKSFRVGVVGLKKAGDKDINDIMDEYGFTFESGSNILQLYSYPASRADKIDADLADAMSRINRFTDFKVSIREKKVNITYLVKNIERATACFSIREEMLVAYHALVDSGIEDVATLTNGQGEDKYRIIDTTGELTTQAFADILQPLIGRAFEVRDKDKGSQTAVGYDAPLEDAHIVITVDEGNESGTAHIVFQHPSETERSGIQDAIAAIVKKVIPQARRADGSQVDDMFSMVVKGGYLTWNDKIEEIATALNDEHAEAVFHPPEVPDHIKALGAAIKQHNETMTYKTKDGFVFEVNGRKLTFKADINFNSIMDYVFGWFKSEFDTIDNKRQFVDKTNGDNLAQNFIGVLGKLSIKEAISKKVAEQFDTIISKTHREYDLSTTMYERSIGAPEGQISDYREFKGEVVVNDNGNAFAVFTSNTGSFVKSAREQFGSADFETNGNLNVLKVPLDGNFSIKEFDAGLVGKFLKAHDDNYGVLSKRFNPVKVIKPGRVTFQPSKNYASLSLKQDVACYLVGLEKYQQYSKVSSVVGFEDINTIEEFYSLCEVLDNYDFEGNYLKAFRCSKYISDARANGGELKIDKNGKELKVTISDDMIIINVKGMKLPKINTPFWNEGDESALLKTYYMGHKKFNDALAVLDNFLDKELQGSTTDVKDNTIADKTGVVKQDDGKTFHFEHQKGGFKIVTKSTVEQIKAFVDNTLDLSDNGDGSIFVKLSHFSQTVGSKKKVSAALVGNGFTEGEHVATPGSAASASKAKLDTIQKQSDLYPVRIEFSVNDALGRVFITKVDATSVMVSDRTGKNDPTAYSELFTSDFKRKITAAFKAESDIDEVVTIINQSLRSGVGIGIKKPLYIYKKTASAVKNNAPVSINWSTAETALKGQYFGNAQYKIVEMDIDEIIKRQSDDFRVDANNPTNRIGKRVETALAHIQSGGTMDRPVVEIDAQGNLQVVDGRHRLAAMKELGIKKAEVFLFEAPKESEDIKILGSNKPSLAVKAPKIERVKITNDAYKITADGKVIASARKSKTKGLNSSGWSVSEFNSGISLTGYETIVTLFNEFKAKYIAWYMENATSISIPSIDLKKIKKVKADVKAKFDTRSVGLPSQDVDNSEKFTSGGLNFTVAGHGVMITSVDRKNSLDSIEMRLKSHGIKTQNTDVGRVVVQFKQGLNNYEFFINERTSNFKGLSGGVSHSASNFVFVPTSVANGSAAQTEYARSNLRKLYVERASLKSFEQFIAQMSGGRSVPFSSNDERQPMVTAVLDMTKEENVSLIQKALGNGMNESMNEGIKEDLTGVAPKVNKVDKSLLEKSMRQLGMYQSSFAYGGSTFTVSMNEGVVDILPTSGNVAYLSKLLGVKLGQDLVQDERGGLRFDIA